MTTTRTQLAAELADAIRLDGRTMAYARTIGYVRDFAEHDAAAPLTVAERLAFIRDALDALEDALAEVRAAQREEVR